MFFPLPLPSVLIVPSVFTRNCLDTKVGLSPLQQTCSLKLLQPASTYPVGCRVGKSLSAHIPSESEWCHQVPATLCWWRCGQEGGVTIEFPHHHCSQTIKTFLSWCFGIAFSNPTTALATPYSPFLLHYSAGCWTDVKILAHFKYSGFSRL